LDGPSIEWLLLLLRRRRRRRRRRRGAGRSRQTDG
jgi:hypothetical protein